MANKVTLKDYQGVECYPKTHEKQVLTGDGSQTLDEKLTELEGKTNQNVFTDSPLVNKYLKELYLEGDFSDFTKPFKVVNIGYDGTNVFFVIKDSLGAFVIQQNSGIPANRNGIFYRTSSKYAVRYVLDIDSLHTDGIYIEGLSANVHENSFDIKNSPLISSTYNDIVIHRDNGFTENSEINKYLKELYLEGEFSGFIKPFYVNQLEYREDGTFVFVIKDADGKFVVQISTLNYTETNGIFIKTQIGGNGNVYAVIDWESLGINSIFANILDDSGVRWFDNRGIIKDKAYKSSLSPTIYSYLNQSGSSSDGKVFGFTENADVNKYLKELYIQGNSEGNVASFVKPFYIANFEYREDGTFVFVIKDANGSFIVQQNTSSWKELDNRVYYKFHNINSEESRYAVFAVFDWANLTKGTSVSVSKTASSIKDNAYDINNSPTILEEEKNRNELIENEYAETEKRLSELGYSSQTITYDYFVPREIYLTKGDILYVENANKYGNAALYLCRNSEAIQATFTKDVTYTPGIPGRSIIYEVQETFYMFNTEGTSRETNTVTVFRKSKDHVVDYIQGQLYEETEKLISPSEFALEEGEILYMQKVVDDGKTYNVDLYSGELPNNKKEYNGAYRLFSRNDTQIVSKVIDLPGLKKFAYSSPDSATGGVYVWKSRIAKSGSSSSSNSVTSPFDFKLPSFATIKITSSPDDPFTSWPENKDKHDCQMEYEDDFGRKLNLPIKASYQGNSTMAYVKKGWRLNLYSDENRENKYALAIGTMQKMDGFNLKAYWTDKSMAREIAISRLAIRVKMMREFSEQFPWNKDAQIITNATGIINGFPCVLYVDGEFYGIQSFNLKKDGNNYMIFDDADGAMIICEQNVAGVWDTFDQSQWTDEFNDEMSESNIAAMERLFSFWKLSNDEIKSSYAEYINLNDWIDYYIFTELFALNDSLCKNMMLYFDKTKTISSPFLYDMDRSMGYGNANTQKSILTQASAQDLTPWTKLKECFWSEIVSRFNEMLSSGIISPEAVKMEMYNYQSGIPFDEWNKELAKYPERFTLSSPTLSDMLDWYSLRFDWVKSYFV